MEVTLEETQIGKGTRHTDAWGQNIPGREKSKYKGPGVGVCLVCSRLGKEAGDGME